MPWKNADKDGVPKRNQEVLISINGANYIAKYNDTDKGFEVTNTKRFF
ncbi:MAG: hypothetical protein K0S53_2627 [Bacteroidetes bacterium]|jgi:hypothetical protein|nr:hypothetical protein [Bacteroidota bacterium]